MEKTIAELDGTLVLNYIDDDDDNIEFIETTDKEEELKLDTSFDENQNPKPKSKSATADETPKKDKDLIVLLDNKVLTPKRLASVTDGGETNDSKETKLDAFKEATSSQPLNCLQVDNSGLRTKRARSDITKDLDSPKTKKVRTKDPIVKDSNTRKLNIPIETKELESPKPKRGRPKSKANKLISSKVTSESLHLKPKETKEDIVEAKQQDAVMETKDLDSSKRKRGRPKGVGSKKEPNISGANTGPQPSIDKNIEERVLEVKQNKAVTSKDASPTVIKVKRGRSKGLGIKKIDASVVSQAVESGKAVELENKDLKPKQLDVQEDMTKSQLLKIKGASLETEQQNVSVEPKDLGPSKPKRGRPKRKLLDVQVDQAPLQLPKYKETHLEAEKQNGTMESKDLGSSIPAKRRSKGKDFEAKSEPPQINKTSLEAQQQDATVKSKDLGPPKPKRGRPKGFKVKKDKISLVNKDLKAFKSDRAERVMKKVMKQLESSLVSNSLGNDLDRSKVNTLKALGLEAKQVFASVTVNNIEASSPQESEVGDLGAKKLNTAVKYKYLVPSKGRRGRLKGLKAKKVTLSTITKNVEAERTKKIALKPQKLNSSAEAEVLESFKSKTNHAVVLEMEHVNAAVINNNLEASKSEEIEAKNLGVTKSDVTITGSNINPSKSKEQKLKSLVTKKVNPATVGICLEHAKPNKTKIADVGSKQLNALTALKNLKPPQSKVVKAKGLERKKVNVSAATAEPLSSKSKRTEEQKQQNAVMETIDLEAPINAKRGKGSEARKVNVYDAAKDIELPKAKETENKGVRSKQLFVSKRPAPSQSKESVERDLQAKQHEDIVEIIDLQPPKPKTGRPKILRAKKLKALVSARTSQSKGIIETIDLDPPNPKKSKVQGLDAKDLEKPKAEEIKIGNIVEGNQILEPSKQKDADGKRIRKLGSCGGSKESKFPKLKRVKTLAVKRVSAFVAPKGTKPAKSEGFEEKSVEQKQDASVGTKDLEAPKFKEVEVQSLPRRPLLCTVATQTIEIEEDDVDNISKAPEEKSLERKTSVSSVGTQVFELPKLKGADVKDLGRKTSVSTAEIIDLDAPRAKNAEGKNSEEKRLNSSVGKRPFESAVSRGVKISESGDKNNQNDDETVKIEDDNLNGNVAQPAVTAVEEIQEIGVKYEALEQIHTEFKYESQSETEEMMKKRRGKLGGPMRGRRRGFNKMEGQTKIDSFFRIVDLNGKIQMKCRTQIFKCDHCLYVGNSKANLERHSLIHRNPDEIMWFHCTECPYKSKYEHQLKSHFLIHMKPDQIQFFQCPHCEVKCSRKHNLTNHIKSIHADREYSFKCAECKYSTFSKDRLVAHIKKHSKEVHACTLCKFVTKRLEYLESHFKMKHMEEVPRPFPCDTCSYKGKTKRELDKHYDRMHNKEQLHVYQCNHCSFNSIYKKNLEFHLLHMHNNSEGFQKFICGHCQKTFSYKNGLKVHIIRCHIKLPDDDWHKCLECKYKSKDVSTLKRHIKRNHGAPRLHCQQCSFATNRQSSMDAHMKTHEYDNEDILKCPECPYRIIQLSSFMYHMKVIHGKPITSKEAEQYYMQDE